MPKTELELLVEAQSAKKRRKCSGCGRLTWLADWRTLTAHIPGFKRDRSTPLCLECYKRQSYRERHPEQRDPDSENVYTTIPHYLQVERKPVKPIVVTVERRLGWAPPEEIY